MNERILFLTGRLAQNRLEKVLQGMEPTAFGWSVLSVGVKVAALMTEPILMRRLPRPINADRVIVPGRCRADLTRLAQEFGLPFQRGPDELKDLPMFLGRAGAALDLSRHALRIFAEIVDASQLSLEAILARADVLRVEGADADELRRGGLAGADYLLSLTERNLAIAEETGARPVLIPAQHGDLASLYRAAEDAEKRGLAAILDPVIDPIHFGFADSLSRYREARARLPEAEMLMGTGNLTELTDADSVGVTALLLGICSELAIANVLTVHVGSHTRRTIQEHDAARRIMYAAAADHSLPRGYGRALLQVHDQKPFPYTSREIAEISTQVKDDNYRIEAAEDGIHVYSRAGHFVAQDAFALFDKLGVKTDGAHAFYLGAELTKAEIAFQLGKRYAQDEPLDWGCATDPRAEDRTRLSEAGHTLRSRAPSE
jgi:dihydropteroate synthase